MVPHVFIICASILVLFMLASILFANEKTKKQVDPFAKVDKQKVEMAQKKGLEFLLNAIQADRPLNLSVGPPNQTGLSDEELVLYTLIKGGTNQEEGTFTRLLDKVLAKKLERTYPVSVLAMALSELDAQKYQAQIAECGQFLIDNQCENGQWDYGKPVEPLGIKITPPETDGKDNSSGGIKRIELKQRKKGTKTGCNSNTQYACLGLRACMNASVIIPSSIFALTQQWLEKDQQKDGGWGYGAVQGQNTGYGSMTVGALGSLAICKFYLTKKLPTNDPKIQSGLQWLIKNFTVLENPKYLTDVPQASPQQRKIWDYYYFYALERLGAFLETESFGSKEWYPAGVEVILQQQSEKGFWSPGKPSFEDTCFAILFLRRATKPLKAKITGPE